VGAALTRLSRIASGRFGDALMATIVLDVLRAGTILGGAYCGVLFVGDLLQFQLVGDTLAPFALFAFGVTLPYFVTARLFVYLNFRTRLEGWDVQTRFGELLARAETEPEPAAVTS
jgi:hypothetical protein